MSSEFACPFCDQFPQALVKGEIHEIIKSSLGRASECEGERLSCRPTFFGRTSKACAANKRYLRYLRSHSQCLLSLLFLSLSTIYVSGKNPSRANSSLRYRERSRSHSHVWKPLFNNLCIKTSMIFGLISKSIFRQRIARSMQSIKFGVDPNTSAANNVILANRLCISCLECCIHLLHKILQYYLGYYLIPSICFKNLFREISTICLRLHQLNLVQAVCFYSCFLQSSAIFCNLLQSDNMACG